MKRLVTRSDFDGLVCAMLLKELGIIEEIKFVHPKDVQDGKVELSENDITTNLLDWHLTTTKVNFSAINPKISRENT